jgi:hypothetical protein
MNKNILKSTIVALATTVIATSAMAEETKHGKGHGNGAGQTNTGQTASGGTRTCNGTGQQASKPPTPQPAAKPAPTPVSSTPASGGFGRGHANTPGIDRTQAMQAREIERGVRTGSLTAAEAAQLRSEQARIAEMEREAKADGNVTHAERAEIRKAQRQAEQHIWEESHDRERDHNKRGHRWGRSWW